MPYNHLLSPGRIGNMELRNRLIVTAMGVNLAESDGTCGERIRAFHAEHAAGGVGLVNAGVAGVAWPIGANLPNQIAISDDRFIPGLAAMADAVHAHGAKFSIQLHHGGFAAMEDLLAGRPVWAPSPPPAPTGDFTEAFLLEELEQAPFRRIKGVKLKVMTVDDIQLVVEQFASAAERAQGAGADGIELHCAHGYLLSSFISPKSNRRDDAYGGSLENRTRILVEVIRAIRARVGADYPVWCKLDSREVGVDSGISLDDARRTAVIAQNAGADAITVSAYHDSGRGELHSASHTPQEAALNLPFASAIRKDLRIPVIASGRVEPDVGDAHIAAGAIDFVAMGRKLLADPHLPNKLQSGRAADILPCIYCYTCISAIYTCGPVRCAVNPRTGFEYIACDADRKPSADNMRKRAVVIGGGPAGMEAARRLQHAGIETILLERGARLGGTLQFAALAYEPNERLLQWLRRQVAAAGIDVRLDTAATPALLQELQPDHVVVATGARRDMPTIPGSDLPHVFSGGELVGVELAEFLQQRGRNVSLIDTVPRFGGGLTVVRRMRALAELKEHGVALYPEASAIAIEPGCVRFNDSNGEPQRIEAQHVIVAKGATGDIALAQRLRADGFAVFTAGDCNGVGYIEGAMRGAAGAVAEIARTIG